MENASKALIIAGAILLAILLISLGIMIFNQAQDTVDNSGMSQAEITAFNNKFLKYEGEQKASVVKSLINEVISEKSHPVTVKVGKKGSEANTTLIIVQLIMWFYLITRVLYQQLLVLKNNK